MRSILLLLLVTCSSIVFGQDKSYDYCYTNNKGVCVYSVADKAEYLIVKRGLAPCISPDGKKVAYITFPTVEADRKIIVIDLNTKKKVVLNTGSNNCYNPVWSSDGKLIAYDVTHNYKKDIAVMDANNTSSPTILTSKVEDCHIWSWQVGNKNVVVQSNMDKNKFYVLDMSGNIISTYKISDIVKTDHYPSSDDRLVFTPDNKKIVFSIETDKEDDRIGRPSAVFVYDIDNQSTLRLSPKGYAAHGVVIKNNQVLFNAYGLRTEPPIQYVYTVDMDGKNLKVLLKNCWDISAKN